MPSREQIEEQLQPFRGTFTQQPPAFSAKKIEGRRSYRLARAHQRATAALPAPPALPAPTSVTVTGLEILDTHGDLLRVSISCSSGFYVRSLAHDLGVALGVGAHLAALRRTEASGRTLNDSVPLSAIEELPEGAERARQALVPLAEVLPELPRLTLTPEGVRRAASGPRDLSPESRRDSLTPWPRRVRLLNDSQNLVGIGDLTPAGLLHPVVVLM
jgi:tRNA pseudouridine55 synthase